MQSLKQIFIKGQHYKQRGFTLVELMITMAVLAIIAAIAIPTYQGYVEEGKMQSARGNVEPLRLALEDYFLENGTYEVGEWTVGGTQNLDDNIGWHPDGDGAQYNYTVTAGDGCTKAQCYKLTVSNIDGTATITCNRNQTDGTFSCL